MPCTLGSSTSDCTSASTSAWVTVAGSVSLRLIIPASAARSVLHPHVAVARPVVADEHGGQAHRRRTGRLDRGPQPGDDLVAQAQPVHQDRPAGVRSKSVTSAHANRADRSARGRFRATRRMGRDVRARWHVERPAAAPTSCSSTASRTPAPAWAPLLDALADDRAARHRRRPPRLRRQRAAADLGALDDPGAGRRPGASCSTARPSIVGHSLGAGIALQLALDAPDLRRRISSCSRPCRRAASTSSTTSPPNRLAHPTPEEQRALLRAAFQRMPDEATMAALQATIERADPRHIEGAARSMRTFVIEDRLAEIRCPVLLVAGDRDRHVPLRNHLATWAALRRAGLHVEHGVGHVPFVEATETSARLVRDLLDRGGGPPAMSRPASSSAAGSRIEPARRASDEHALDELRTDHDRRRQARRASAAPSSPGRARTIWQQHVGLVALGRDRRRRAEPGERGDDQLTRVRAARERHPRPPCRRRADRRARRGHHDQRLAQQLRRSPARAATTGGSTHTTRSSSPSRSRASSSADGATDSVSCDIGALGAERGDDVGEVHDGGDVDHPDAHPALPRAAHGVGPVDEVARSAPAPAGRGRAPAPPSARSTRRRPCDSNSGTPSRRSSSARPCDSADGLTPTRSRGDRPRRLVGDGDEVLELADRQVGKRRLHPAQDSSDLLHHRRPGDQACL